MHISQDKARLHVTLSFVDFPLQSFLPRALMAPLPGFYFSRYLSQSFPPWLNDTIPAVIRDL